MKHYPDQDVADNRRSVRRRARQLEQRQRRALREQGQQLLERAGRVMGPRNDEGPLPRIDWSSKSGMGARLSRRSRALRDISCLPSA